MLFPALCLDEFPVDHHMPLIAISLDVVGSTSIKSKLAEFSAQHGTDLDRHYSELAKLMLVSMNRFMELLDLDDILDINRLFLVKRIGDEYWWVYDLNDLAQHEISRHATHLVKALLAYFSKTPFDLVAMVPEELDDPYAEPIAPVAILRLPVPWKATVDVLNHVIDLSKLAEEKLDSFLAGLTSQGRARNFVTAGDAEFLELKNRLGVGFGITREERLVYGTRSDFIGIEVDRFFRISKFAEEGKILAGREFLSILTMNEVATGKYEFCDSLGGGSITTVVNRVRVNHRTFTEDEIKGIKGGYAGAHIFDEYSSAIAIANPLD